MITRKLGKFLRGKATPFQVLAACILGSLLGFAPGFREGPALYLLVITTLLVVNANLGLALMVGGFAKLASYFLAPYSFRLGQWLLDGPATDTARSVVNAPVLAWAGLESYAVTGGMVIGLGLGLVGGLIGAVVLRSFRKRMIAAHMSPGRMQALASNPFSRFIIWLFFGGKGKQSWEQKLAKNVGNPIRIGGVVLLAVVFGGLWYAQSTLAGPAARDGMQAGLESVNGATVDVGAVDIDLAGGLFAVSGLALADAEDLERDVFRAGRLEADLSQEDLLRRRFTVSRLVVSDAESGVLRATPGKLVGPPPEPLEEEVEEGDGSTYSLEQVLADYQLWKERLETARRWLDKLSGEEGEEGAEGAPEAPADETPEALAERLRRQAEAEGWFTVDAEHLREKAPAFRFSEVVVDGLKMASLPDRIFDVRGHELSSNPGYVDESPRLEVESRDGQIELVIDLAPASRLGGNGALRFAWRGLSIDSALAQLELDGPPPLQGGTLDLELDGAWDQGRIGYVNLPLTATLHDTVLQVEGVDPTPLDRLVLPIGIEGSIDSPRIHFDTSTFTDALIAAGKAELAAQVDQLKGRAQEEIQEQVDELKQEAQDKLEQELSDELKEKLPDAKKALGGFLGGKKGDGPN